MQRMKNFVSQKFSGATRQDSLHAVRPPQQEPHAPGAATAGDASAACGGPGASAGSCAGLAAGAAGVAKKGAFGKSAGEMWQLEEQTKFVGRIDVFLSRFDKLLTECDSMHRDLGDTVSVFFSRNTGFRETALEMADVLVAFRAIRLELVLLKERNEAAHHLDHYTKKLSRLKSEAPSGPKAEERIARNENKLERASIEYHTAEEAARSELQETLGTRFFSAAQLVSKALLLSRELFSAATPCLARLPPLLGALSAPSDDAAGILARRCAPCLGAAFSQPGFPSSVPAISPAPPLSSHALFKTPSPADLLASAQAHAASSEAAPSVYTAPHFPSAARPGVVSPQTPALAVGSQSQVPSVAVFPGEALGPVPDAGAGPGASGGVSSAAPVCVCSLLRDDSTALAPASRCDGSSASREAGALPSVSPVSPEALPTANADTPQFPGATGTAAFPGGPAAPGNCSLACGAEPHSSSQGGPSGSAGVGGLQDPLSGAGAASPWEGVGSTLPVSPYVAGAHRREVLSPQAPSCGSTQNAPPQLKQPQASAEPAGDRIPPIRCASSSSLSFGHHYPPHSPAEAAAASLPGGGFPESQRRPAGLTANQGGLATADSLASLSNGPATAEALSPSRGVRGRDADAGQRRGENRILRWNTVGAAGLTQRLSWSRFRRRPTRQQSAGGPGPGGDERVHLPDSPLFAFPETAPRVANHTPGLPRPDPGSHRGQTCPMSASPALGGVQNPGNNEPRSRGQVLSQEVGTPARRREGVHAPGANTSCANTSAANTSGGANTSAANTSCANTSGANTSCGANTSAANTSCANTSGANTSCAHGAPAAGSGEGQDGLETPDLVLAGSPRPGATSVAAAAPPLKQAGSQSSLGARSSLGNLDASLPRTDASEARAGEERDGHSSASSASAHSDVFVRAATQDSLSVVGGRSAQASTSLLLAATATRPGPEKSGASGGSSRSLSRLAQADIPLGAPGNAEGGEADASGKDEDKGREQSVEAGAPSRSSSILTFGAHGEPERFEEDRPRTDRVESVSAGGRDTLEARETESEGEPRQGCSSSSVLSVSPRERSSEAEESGGDGVFSAPAFPEGVSPRLGTLAVLGMDGGDRPASPRQGDGASPSSKSGSVSSRSSLLSSSQPASPPAPSSASASFQLFPGSVSSSVSFSPQSSVLLDMQGPPYFSLPSSLATLPQRAGKTRSASSLGQPESLLRLQSDSDSRRRSFEVGSPDGSPLVALNGTGHETLEPHAAVPSSKPAPSPWTLPAFSRRRGSAGESRRRGFGPAETPWGSGPGLEMSFPVESGNSLERAAPGRSAFASLPSVQHADGFASPSVPTPPRLALPPEEARTQLELSSEPEEDAEATPPREEKPRRERSGDEGRRQCSREDEVFAGSPTANGRRRSSGGHGGRGDTDPRAAGAQRRRAWPGDRGAGAVRPGKEETARDKSEAYRTGEPRRSRVSSFAREDSSSDGTREIPFGSSPRSPPGGRRKEPIWSDDGSDLSAPVGPVSASGKNREEAGSSSSRSSSDREAQTGRRCERAEGGGAESPRVSWKVYRD
ncbi:conserved hypothetical protein [Neospora caninum Liverpool]|uniref:BAR domain-containing protein n=1 Tax=Neospora caninum (strain Liverpool) TaxID=572307 RepID=F0VMD8_NEOCL|nr:conserved hypothetical protein [Neospora caninum Liverpool]CBZ54416.1 conserved hypothetical protein [Neospora caninum Liverpool]|eukprot:XP_003884446.1 conserved hypothetical protein [Neospora caninum Liverpool]